MQRQPSNVTPYAFDGDDLVRSYSYLMSAGGSYDGHYVELLESKFLEILRCFLAYVEVDEEWYLAMNSDVREAIATGAIKSGKAHYVLAGYFENRIPRQIEVDTDWYIAEYPDLAEAICNGAFVSVSQHFERDGFREGRQPCENWSLLGKVREF